MSSQSQPQLIEFPDLKKFLIQIQEDIINKRLEIYEKLPYGARIRERGVLSIADELLKVIRPEIRALQGKQIDRETLDRIRLQQNVDGSWLEKWATSITLPTTEPTDSFETMLGNAALLIVESMPNISSRSCEESITLYIISFSG